MGVWAAWAWWWVRQKAGEWAGGACGGPPAPMSYSAPAGRPPPSRRTAISSSTPTFLPSVSPTPPRPGSAHTALPVLRQHRERPVSPSSGLLSAPEVVGASEEWQRGAGAPSGQYRECNLRQAHSLLIRAEHRAPQPAAPQRTHTWGANQHTTCTTPPPPHTPTPQPTPHALTPTTLPINKENACGG